MREIRAFSLTKSDKRGIINKRKSRFRNGAASERTVKSMNFGKLDALLRHLSDYGIPTCDLTVWQDHKELYRGASATEALPSPDALYFMYSCSKVITCAAALQFYEKGRFLLHTPVSEFLPEFAQLRVNRANGAGIDPASKTMTMGQLFTMTSGLNYNLSTSHIAKMREATGGRCPTREAVRAIAKAPLNFEPGEHFLYGLSHDVLAAAVEVMADESFGEYVRKNIFEPLGMTDSHYHVTPDVEARMAKQYLFDDKTHHADEVPKKNAYILGPDYESGGAGMISSLHDMIRFADAMACGGIGATGARILAPSTVALMKTPMLTPAQKETFVWKMFRGGYSYGLGVNVQTDKTFGMLSPLGEFGWQSAAGSLMCCDTENKVSIFYAQHMLHNQEAYVHPRIRNVVYACLEDAVKN